MGNYKYAYFTDRIYQRLQGKRSRVPQGPATGRRRQATRHHVRPEVLQIIASFEAGFAHELTEECRKLGRKLIKQEADQVFVRFESHPLWAPQLLNARTKMASRDWQFRDALHHRLEEYIKAVPREDFERFLDKTSMSLEERLKETREVFKRLKDR